MCIPTGTPTEDISNYLQFNLRDAMTFFWRVRSWRIQISGSVSYNLQEGFGRESITFLGGTAQLAPLVGTEEELSCFSGIFDYAGYYLPAQRTNDFGSDTISFGNEYEYFFQNNTGYTQFDAINNGNTFYVPVLLLGSGGFIDYSNLNEGGTVIGEYTISFNGVLKSGYIYAPPFVNREYSGLYQLNITAGSYWSYGGTYDTATGNPL